MQELNYFVNKGDTSCFQQYGDNRSITSVRVSTLVLALSSLQQSKHQHNVIR